MSNYTIVLADNLEAEVQRELTQRLSEEPGLTAADIVQSRSEIHWKRKANDRRRVLKSQTAILLPEDVSRQFLAADEAAQDLAVEAMRTSLGVTR